MKEIAYRWGKSQLLNKFELVLLVCLRDPALQQTQSIDDLLQLFYRRDKNATDIVSTCSEYLSRNGGITLTLLLDGYDEYPEHLRQSSLIADILKRQVLPLCGLVVSSRPHVSEHFHSQAVVRVDILGFTETERENYIKQAFPDQSHKAKELIQYLNKQPSIDSLCFIPFHMVVLLYLYKQGISLPNNSTELYSHFICLTICRHLCKLGTPLKHDITDLTNLPEPYNGIIKQLSKLSLKALSNNKLIFTFDEVTAACPNITAAPGAINGFGLLQAVQHFGLHTKRMTLNFIHFTIQEFLAAHYIAHLPPHEELNIIEEKFWSDIHFNMFFMYTALTKGQRASFKYFLSYGCTTIDTISDKFLNDQLKCLHLHHHFNEAGDHTMCSAIEQAVVFYDKIIRLGTRLTASDMECLATFLTKSLNKEWVLLNLYDCSQLHCIQDHQLNILYRGLYHSNDITINELRLDYNILTTQSSSIVSDITIKCKVKVLVLTGNCLTGEDCQLYSMLTDHTTMLETLCMRETALSSIAAINLFTALKDNNRLKKFSIEHNAITDDACDAITAALEKNSCLLTLNMHNNPLSCRALLAIVQSLQVNDTLEFLGLPECSQAVKENIRSLKGVVNKKRESRGYQVKLNIIHNAIYLIL